MSETTAYIGLGSNLDNREAYIRDAIKKLSEAEGIEVGQVSKILETEALGQAQQPKYLNAVVKVKTSLTAKEFHKKTAEIEDLLGRARGEKWSSRTIDLDILLFGEEIINEPKLIVPHPQMHLRSFVLKGLCEIDGQLLHPVLKESVEKLAERLGGGDFVFSPNLPQLVSVAGVIGVGKTTLVKKVSELFGCRQLLEPYDENPFLSEVYSGRDELALDSQLFFLAGRAKQLNAGELETGRIYASDYVFDKELIYARRLLDKRQLCLYEQLYPHVSGNVSRPVLVIYLQDSVENCLDRIHQRNRPYEQAIEKQFLKTLSYDYQELFRDWKKCPVIRIEASKLDYSNQEYIEHLTNQVKGYIAI